MRLVTQILLLSAAAAIAEFAGAAPTGEELLAACKAGNGAEVTRISTEAPEVVNFVSVGVRGLVSGLLCFALVIHVYSMYMRRRESRH